MTIKETYTNVITRFKPKMHKAYNKLPKGIQWLLYFFFVRLPKWFFLSTVHCVKQFHLFLWTSIIFAVAIACYFVAGKETWLHTFFLYALIAAAIFCGYAFINYIVSFCLAPYTRKKEKAKAEADNAKREFSINYITKGYINRPIYDALKEVFSYDVNRGGKNFVQTIYVAKRIGWLTKEMPYQDATSYFGVEVVGKGANYSEQTTKNNKTPIDGEKFQNISAMLTTTLDKTEAAEILADKTAGKKIKGLRKMLIRYLSK